jgi:hypothetical protein
MTAGQRELDRLDPGRGALLDERLPGLPGRRRVIRGGRGRASPIASIRAMASVTVVTGAPAAAPQLTWRHSTMTGPGRTSARPGAGAGGAGGWPR